MDIEERGCEAMDWIQLPQDRAHWRAVVNTVMNFRISYIGKFLDQLKVYQLYRRSVVRGVNYMNIIVKSFPLQSCNARTIRFLNKPIK
jgi:hypothetical protein